MAGGRERHDGSWWPEWNAWVSQFGGDKVPARMPGDGKLKALEDAPGSYAKLRLDAKKKDAPADVAPAVSAGGSEPPTRAANDPGAGSPLDLLSAAAAATPTTPALRPQTAGDRDGRSPTPRKPRNKP